MTKKINGLKINFSSGTLISDSDDKYQKKKSLKILFVTNMYPRKDKQGSGTFVMQQAEYIRKLGNSVDVFHVFGYRSKLNYIKAAFDVRYITKKKRYDIVHAHYGLAGFAALFRNGLPFVLTLHGSDALIGIIQPLISKYICRYADAVIAVSQHIAKIIPVPGDVIPCGVDLEFFKPQNKKVARQKLGLPFTRNLILFPFDPQRKLKRYDLAQEAVAKLSLLGHDSELVVVHGIKNEDMPWYYNAADAMILCSDSEGSPTSVKEALACNTPVVATRVGDVTEVMDGIEGIKICKNNVDEIAGGLYEVLSPKKRFVFNGRSAMRTYDQEQTINAIIAVYKRTIQKRAIKG